LQTEPNKIHSEPSPSFFQKPNRNRTEIKKSIPHIPTKKKLIVIWNISGARFWASCPSYHQSFSYFLWTCYLFTVA